MPTNPFSEAIALAEPPAASNSSLPFMLAGVAVGVALLSTGLSWLLLWQQFPEKGLEYWLDFLPMYLTGWIGKSLLAATGVLLITRRHLERHAITGYRQPAQLLASYALLSLLIHLGLPVLLHPIYGLVFEELTRGPLLGVVSKALGWGLFALDTLLPLVLCLRLFKERARSGNGAGTTSGLFVALTYALCFSALYFELLTLIDMTLVKFMLEGWQYAAGLGSVLLNGAVVLLAARYGLPARLLQLNAGRLLLASLAAMLLLLAFACLLVFAVDLRSLNGAPLALGVAQLALLWPLTHLALKWVYRPAAA